MGVRRLFPGEGKNPGGVGGKNILLLTKKVEKRYSFSQKSLRTYCFFGRPQRARAPLPPPPDAHAIKQGS